MVIAKTDVRFRAVLMVKLKVPGVPTSVSVIDIVKLRLWERWVYLEPAADNPSQARSDVYTSR